MVGVKAGLPLDRLGSRHQERINMRHHPDILQGLELCLKDLCLRHQDDNILSIRFLTEDHNRIHVDRSSNLSLFSRTDQDHRLLDKQLLLRGLGALE
jgi:hypothetical protein